MQIPHRLMSLGVLLAVASIGCSPAGTDDAQAAVVKTTTKPASCAATRAAFWTRFRAALLSTDPAAIVPLTRFPLTVRGEMDDDPVRRIDAAELRRILPSVLQADSGIKAEEYSLRQLVADTPVPKASSCTVTSGEFAVGSMTFRLQRDGWKLARLYH